MNKRNLFSPIFSFHNKKDKIFVLDIFVFVMVLFGLLLILLVILGFLEEYFLDFLPQNWVNLIGIQTPPEGESSSKSIWDLLQVLVLPILLAIGAALISQSYKNVQEKRLGQAQSKDLLFKDYLKTLQTLILENNLLNSEIDSPIRILSQGYTFSVINELDGKWLGATVDLLGSLGLVSISKPTISLFGYKFNHANFEDRRLVNMELSSVVMERSIWDRAVCRNLDLSNANLKYASLKNANFYNCDFTNTVFHGANLERVVFDSCNLTGANFTGANLRGAKIPNTCLDTIRYDRKTRMDKDIALILFLYSTTSQAISFPGIAFSGADLTGVFLQKANLKRADFSQCNLRHANFKGANLEGANLTRTILDFADFRGANLKNADLRWASIKNIIVDELTVMDDKWKLVANLVSGRVVKIPSGTDLNYVDLSSSNLSGLDFTGVSFIGSDLQFTLFDNSNLSNCNFSSQIIKTDDEVLEIKNNSHVDVRVVSRLRSAVPWYISFLAPQFGPRQNKDMQERQKFFVTVLTGASMKDANLKGAIFTDSIMDFVNLHGVIVDESTCMDQKCRLIIEILNISEDSRDLSGEDLSYADLSYAQLREANLSNADLKFTDLSNSDLKFANLLKANLINAELAEADLMGADLSYTLISKDQLKNARNSEYANTKNTSWINWLEYINSLNW